jgi:hypothetical protein
MHQRSMSSREMSNTSEVTTTVKDEIVEDVNSGLLPSMHHNNVIYTTNSAVFVPAHRKLGPGIITGDHEFLAEQGYPFPPSAVAVSSYSHQVNSARSTPQFMI